MIGIIAVLLAILLPTLSQVRASARTTACAANLQQIDRGLQMYANENDGTVHPTVSLELWPWWDHVPGLEDSYGRHVSRYPFQDEVYIQCPEAPQTFYSDDTTLGPFEADTFTYLFNGHIENLGIKRVGRVGDISASEIVVMGEVNFFNTKKGRQVMIPGRFDESVELHRHGRGSNYLFLDGHVAWEEPWDPLPGAADPWDIPFVQPSGTQ